MSKKWLEMMQQTDFVFTMAIDKAKKKRGLKQNPDSNSKTRYLYITTHSILLSHPKPTHYPSPPCLSRPVCHSSFLRLPLGGAWQAGSCRRPGCRE